MKKIPPGSEASNVLVGEVDFLSHPIIAFVRLANSQVLGDLTEIPIPTRFLFILLGPKGNQERFHEIGRSIATLMSDEVCVCVCVCACMHVCMCVCVYILRGEYRQSTYMYLGIYVYCFSVCAAGTLSIVCTYSKKLYIIEYLSYS